MYHANHATFELPAQLKDKTMHMFTLRDDGPSEFNVVVSHADVKPEERLDQFGERLTKDEIETFVAGVTAGRITEGQVGAFAMAVLLKGMTMDERVALTLAMARSGEVLDWSGADLPGPAIDKHSTGGVGDKVSLILAPVLAACGGEVWLLAPGQSWTQLGQKNYIWYPGARTFHPPSLRDWTRPVRRLRAALIERFSAPCTG